MAESLRTRFLRWKFNWFPAYRGSGARITYIDATLREVRLRLPLNWRTRKPQRHDLRRQYLRRRGPHPRRDARQSARPGRLRGLDQGGACSLQAPGPHGADRPGSSSPRRKWSPSARTWSARAGWSAATFVELHDTAGKVCAVCDILVHIHPREREERASAPAEAPVASTASVL